MNTKILTAATLVLGFRAFAAPEKALTIQLADKNGLVQAATKAGELVGYPMLGTMASMGLADNPINKELGAFRDGASELLVLHLDPEKLQNGDVSTAFCGFACLYAPVMTKEEFLAADEDRKEEDGVIKIDSDAFVAYSEDGKWAAVATSPEYAKGALADVAVAQKPMNGDVMRVSLAKTAMSIFGKILAEIETTMEAEGKADAANIKDLVEISGMVDSFDFGVRVADAGIDMHGILKPTPGSELTKIGTSPLEGNALAFAPADALIACAYAKNSGYDGKKLVAIIDGILEFLKDGGVKTDFFSGKEENGVAKYSFDVAAAIKYFSSEEAQAALEALDPEKFQKKFQALCEGGNKIVPDTKPFAVALSVPGADAKTSISELFAKILPEASAKKPCGVGLYRYYSALKTLAPLCVELVPEDGGKSMLQAACASLPSDDGAAIVAANYRDGDSFLCDFRISAQEIRGWTAVVNAGIAYFAMVSGGECDSCDEDDDDDGDDDSCEDDDDAVEEAAPKAE